MVANFLAGGAVVNAFAAQTGAEVVVVDVGVAADLDPAPGLLPRKVAPGTADMTAGAGDDPRRGARRASRSASRSRATWSPRGNRCLLTGDMGIANTTASAALIAAFTGADPRRSPGAAPASTTRRCAHKVEVVARALDLHRPDPADPIGVLAAVGGLEHAALAGFLLGAAALRVPVVLDGVIAGAAALVAAALAPGRRRRLDRRAPLRPSPAHAVALRAPGPAPARRPGSAPRRGHRRACSRCRWCRRRARPARGRDLRLRRRHGEVMSGPRTDAYPLGLRLPGAGCSSSAAARWRSAGCRCCSTPGADVSLVSPSVTAGDRGAGRPLAGSRWEARPYAPSDVDGAWYVLAAHRRSRRSTPRWPPTPRPRGSSASAPTTRPPPPPGPRRSAGTTA